MPWIMEIDIDGIHGCSTERWVPLSMEKKAPYEYDRAIEAMSMLCICYPDQVRSDRLSGLEGRKCTRIRETTTGKIVYGNGNPAAA